MNKAAQSPISSLSLPKQTPRGLLIRFLLSLCILILLLLAVAVPLPPLP